MLQFINILLIKIEIIPLEYNYLCTKFLFILQKQKMKMILIDAYSLEIHIKKFT